MGGMGEIGSAACYDPQSVKAAVIFIISAIIFAWAVIDHKEPPKF